MQRALVAGIAEATNRIYRFGLVEIALIVSAFFFYSIVRQFSSDRVAEAFGNAFSLVQLERNLGIFYEAQIQAFVLDSTTFTKFFNGVYIYGHLPFVAVIGIWLFLFHRGRYPGFRNALLLSGVIGLLIFNVFPMAPPRLLPLPYGLVDTLSLYSRVNYHSSGDFVNPYAAMPSMHVAWNFVASLCLFSALRVTPARLLAVVPPVLMGIAVIVTGNHYVMDVVVGYLLGGVAVMVGMMYSEQLRRISGSPPPGAAASA